MAKKNTEVALLDDADQFEATTLLDFTKEDIANIGVVQYRRRWRDKKAELEKELSSAENKNLKAQQEHKKLIEAQVYAQLSVYEQRFFDVVAGLGGKVTAAEKRAIKDDRKNVVYGVNSEGTIDINFSISRVVNDAKVSITFGLERVSLNKECRKAGKHELSVLQEVTDLQAKIGECNIALSPAKVEEVRTEVLASVAMTALNNGTPKTKALAQMIGNDAAFKKMLPGGDM